jgi:putative ABC transport system permease protein
VSANFFDVIGVQAHLGRTFARGEDLPGHHREIVLSDAFWRSHFAADPNVIQRTAILNGVSFAVIGVMGPSFRFDQGDTDFWIPLAMNLDEVRELRRPPMLRAVARLRPGVTVAQAQADLSQIARALEREYPDTNRQMGVGVGPLDWFVGQTRRPLLTFLAGVALPHHRAAQCRKQRHHRIRGLADLKSVPAWPDRQASGKWATSAPSSRAERI